MAKFRRRKSRALAKTSPEDITVEQRGRAYELWRVGVDPREIQAQVRLTAKQWHAVFYTAGRYRTPAGEVVELPSLASDWVTEVAALRSQAVEAGKRMSERAVTVLGRAMSNADAAEAIMARMLRVWAMDIAEVVDTKQLLAATPPSEILEALRTLRRIADIRPSAQAYIQIFGDAPNPRSARAMVDPTRNRAAIDVHGADPMTRVGERSDSAVVDQEIVQGFARDWGRWTDAQIAHYMATGEEPDPRDVIDAEATSP